MAAGNAAQSPSPDRLGDHLPQLLGTQENSLITVGGVHADGSLQATSEPEGKMKSDPPMQDGSPHPNANRRGSVTIYAQAEDVTGCIGDPADTRSTVKMTGNSFASPAVVSEISQAPLTKGSPELEPLLTCTLRIIGRLGSLPLGTSRFQ